MARSYNKLRLDIGLLLPCTAEENKQFDETMKDGGELPEGVIMSSYKDTSGNPAFFKADPDIPEGEEQQYTLMKISGYLHSITVLLRILLIFGIAAALVLINMLAVR